MANQYLHFEIGSDFSGEGFKKAQQSVHDLNDKVKGGISQYVGATSALAGLDNTVGKATRAVTSLIGVFTSLNPVVMILTGTATAFAYAVKHVEDRQKAALKRTEQLAQALSARMFDKATSEAKRLGSEFESITKHANDLAAAMSALDKERANGGVIALQAEKVEAAMKATTREAEELTSAEYDLKIAIAKAAAARADSEADLAKAHQAVVDMEGRIANLGEQRAAIDEQLARMKKNLLVVENEEAKRMHLSREEYLKQADNLVDGQKKEFSARQALIADIKRMQDQQADIDEKIHSRKQDMEVLLVNEQTAHRKMANVSESCALEVGKSGEAIRRLKETQEERRMKEESLMHELEQNAEIERVKRDQMEEKASLEEKAAQLQKDVNEATRDVAKAEREYEAALKKYEAHYADNKMAEGVFNGKSRKNGMAIPVRIDGAIKAEIATHDLENAIKNGEIRSVKDLNDFQKNRAKELDQAEKDKWNQLKIEKQKYDGLMQTSRKTWSKQDQDFVEKFEKIRAAAVAQKEEIDAAKQRLQEAQQREKENHDNLAGIRKSLKSLGLK